MSVNMFERNASILEMAVEIDRRGAVIQALEADIEVLKDMVADAYNAGFTEGMREGTRSKAEGRPTGSPPSSAR